MLIEDLVREDRASAEACRPGAVGRKALIVMLTDEMRRFAEFYEKVADKALMEYCYASECSESLDEILYLLISRESYQQVEDLRQAQYRAMMCEDVPSFVQFAKFAARCGHEYNNLWTKVHGYVEEQIQNHILLQSQVYEKLEDPSFRLESPQDRFFVHYTNLMILCDRLSKLSDAAFEIIARHIVSEQSAPRTIDDYHYDTTPRQIAQRFGITRQDVIHHLNILAARGIIQAKESKHGHWKLDRKDALSATVYIEAQRRNK